MVVIRSFSDQEEVGRGITNEEWKKEDPSYLLNEDLTQSGYDKRDLDIAVRMSLALPEDL
ncbi:hypothetical protein CHS0354_012153 [Potamilus streckersoni]|uniref:Uncharacterized protein n=1 Tax=Potamilus streckersoni TaxID=2493646 RepID=A0AAE0S9X2_9BIVA|nr:hypothetical protein CHS0354_012153 [Potamilus streckersoni]